MVPMISFAKQRHRHRKQIYGYQQGKVGGGMGSKRNWEIGIEIYTLYISNSLYFSIALQI